MRSRTVEAFGHMMWARLETFLELPHGVLSHDAFGRVVRHLDPLVFERCCRQWTNAVQRRAAGKIIVLDGKCWRHSGDALLGEAALYLVSAPAGHRSSGGLLSCAKWVLLRNCLGRPH